MRVLFLENEDSFSRNVMESLPCDRSDIVVRPGRDADAHPEWMSGVNAVVIGPGPTDPRRAGLIGAVLAAEAAQLPVLGICLGHQAIGLAFGSRLVRAHPAHGCTSEIVFLGSRHLSGISGKHTVMRYHSLVLPDVIEPLAVIAETADGLVMAVEHVSKPVVGLQFHPDSYATPRGREMIEAFFGSIG